MSVLRDIAEAIVGTRAVPPDELALQRFHVLDTVVAGLAGANTPEATALRPLFAGGSNAEVAGLSSAATRLSEIDDIHLRSCVTPSAVAIPTALALVSRGGSASAVASAMWVGTGLMMRLGQAIDGPRVLKDGVWPAYFAAPLGACAVAALLFGLNREETTNALSLSLTMASGSIGQPGDTRTGRWFLFGTAVAVGIRAAEAAKAGLCGDAGLLDGDWIERTRGVAIDQAQLTPLASVYAELSQKPYCTARQCLAAGQALQALLQSGIDGDTISAIRVRVPTAYTKMIARQPEAGSRSSTVVGAPLQLAVIALRPGDRYLVDRCALQRDERLRRFAQRVAVLADERLDPLYPALWPAEIEVDTPQGTVTKRVTQCHGDPGDRLSERGLIEKARRVLATTLDRGATDRWIEMSLAALDGPGQCVRLAREFVAAIGVAPRLPAATAVS